MLRDICGIVYDTARHGGLFLSCVFLIYYFIIKADLSATFIVEARTYIQTDEWIAIKDAMLTAQELGLSQGTITELSGTLNTNNLQKQADGFDILVINIDNYRLSLGR